MNSFEISEVRFTINDSKISLDKSCNIIKEKTNLKIRQVNKTDEQVEKLKTTISQLQYCYNVCNAINTSYRKCNTTLIVNILYPNLNLSEEIIEILNNTITTKTINVFDSNDIYYIKRLLDRKIETLTNYENRKPTNNLTVLTKREVQRRKFLGIKD